ncbi:hypothetical protein GNF10_34585 [Nostoc sp. UCD121]|uniref:hypothetical protein n=1 Tax=unclassified Nostoc TaxID=2593658 RepID=UPI001627A615|nr:MULTISPECIES: hypothetical protein [unclassified Nostoc]MBC1224860.1 hypothetical protein [Nostoc sp. UCD120]MBC1280925.1 hypothetical protein [Nostoc sp. UCD121]MBC1299211.1 hypothetical protein [Nostoc sp. UCD122]
MGSFNAELRDFLEKKPLYSWHKFELPEYSTQLLLSQIEMECPTCRRSRPFSDRRSRGGGTGISTPKLESNIYSFLFTCDSCSSSKYTFFVEVDVEKCKIRKVGQSPAWSINLDGDIDKFLGDDSEYFKKALICESQGYGIAAFSYYRRVLENSIGKILESLRFALEMQGASSENIERIDKALKGIIMDERIKIAKDVIPNSLRPNGMNPLAIIYDTLSAGIHRLPEEECLKNSEYIRVSLSYLIKTLTQQNEEQKAFLDAAKSLNDFNSKFS